MGWLTTMKMTCNSASSSALAENIFQKNRHGLHVLNNFYPHTLWITGPVFWRKYLRAATERLWYLAGRTWGTSGKTSRSIRNNWSLVRHLLVEEAWKHQMILFGISHLPAKRRWQNQGIEALSSWILSLAYRPLLSLTTAVQQTWLIAWSTCTVLRRKT